MPGAPSPAIPNTATRSGLGSNSQCIGVETQCQRPAQVSGRSCVHRTPRLAAAFIHFMQSGNVAFGTTRLSSHATLWLLAPRSPATVGKHGFWSIRSIRRPCRQPDQDKAIDYNRVGEFERLRCQELVKFSGLQRPSLFIRNDDMPSLAGPNARLGNRYQHADPLAAYFLVLSCRYNLICQLASSSIRTPPDIWSCRFGCNSPLK